jgi:hypothetical protein
MPASGKSVNSAVEKFILIANQLAGKRVIDEKCVSINCDKGASELSSL